MDTNMDFPRELLPFHNCISQIWKYMFEILLFEKHISQNVWNVQVKRRERVYMAETRILISQSNFLITVSLRIKSAFLDFVRGIHGFVWNVQVEKRGKGWYVEETNFNFPRDFNSRLCLIHQLLTSIYFKGVHSCFFFKFNTTMNIFCLKITFS